MSLWGETPTKIPKVQRVTTMTPHKNVKCSNQKLGWPSQWGNTISLEAQRTFRRPAGMGLIRTAGQIGDVLRGPRTVGHLNGGSIAMEGVCRLLGQTFGHRQNRKTKQTNKNRKHFWPCLKGGKQTNRLVE